MELQSLLKHFGNHRFSYYNFHKSQQSAHIEESDYLQDLWINPDIHKLWLFTTTSNFQTQANPWKIYFWLTHWGQVTHICISKLTIIVSHNGWSPGASSHYINQCWSIINWTFRNKLQRNRNRNSYIFIPENTFKDVICEIAEFCFGLNVLTALTITSSHQQNTHDFDDARKNMNGIFNNYVRSASHMRSGLHFQNV